MNGAELLTRTLLACGIDTCFANPGTSEMHFVAALDRHPEMRCVLGLFEGVVTGAADGYARMTGRPAATLLHLGPGLGNALANLHNAKKARSPMVTIVGDHASFHVGFESPLRSDVEGVARPMSHWVRTAHDPSRVSELTAEAVSIACARPGHAATLILPADTAWNDAPAGVSIATRPPPRPPQPLDDAMLARAVDALRSGEPAALYLGGDCLLEHNLLAAGRIAAATGCKLISSLFGARSARGAGRVPTTRLPYPPDIARSVLAPFKHLIVVGTVRPVSFFGYPGKRSELEAPGAQLVELGAEIDAGQALARLVEALGAQHAQPRLAPAARVDVPAAGALTPRAANQAVGALMPEGAILVEEAATSSEGLMEATAGAPAHDVLRLTGGAIGIGIPMAAGAAVACPDRKVIGLQADGSGMYTVQGLWTQARERLDVVTIVYSNRSYRILHNELRGVGAGEAGANARRMLDLDDPALDWVSIARGMGVEGASADSAERFTDLLRSGLGRRGPFLIEARL